MKGERLKTFTICKTNTRRLSCIVRLYCNLACKDFGSVKFPRR
jgi:hypothetical protein